MRKTLICLTVIAILGSYFTISSAQVTDSKPPKIVIVVKTPPDQRGGEERER